MSELDRDVEETDKLNESNDSSKPEDTDKRELSTHAEKRKEQGRLVNLALPDAQRANQSQVFIQTSTRAIG